MAAPNALSLFLALFLLPPHDHSSASSSIPRPPRHQRAKSRASSPRPLDANEQPHPHKYPQQPHLLDHQPRIRHPVPHLHHHQSGTHPWDQAARGENTLLFFFRPGGKGWLTNVFLSSLRWCLSIQVSSILSSQAGVSGALRLSLKGLW